MEFTLTFLEMFAATLTLIGPIVLSLLIAIAGIGIWIGHKESWTISDSLYYAFITATTVGYGDFRPSKRRTKYAAIVIALTGLLLTGIIVAIGLQSLEIAISQHHDIEQLKNSFEQRLNQ